MERKKRLQGRRDPQSPPEPRVAPRAPRPARVSVTGEKDAAAEESGAPPPEPPPPEPPAPTEPTEGEWGDEHPKMRRMRAGVPAAAGVGARGGCGCHLVSPRAARRGRGERGRRR